MRDLPHLAAVTMILTATAMPAARVTVIFGCSDDSLHRRPLSEGSRRARRTRQVMRNLVERTRSTSGQGRCAHGTR